MCLSLLFNTFTSINDQLFTSLIQPKLLILKLIYYISDKTKNSDIDVGKILKIVPIISQTHDQSTPMRY